VRGSGGKRSGEGEGWEGWEAGRKLEGKEEKYDCMYQLTLILPSESVLFGSQLLAAKLLQVRTSVRKMKPMCIPQVLCAD
jgi:hypothetical protein